MRTDSLCSARIGHGAESLRQCGSKCNDGTMLNFENERAMNKVEEGNRGDEAMVVLFSSRDERYDTWK